MRAYKIQLEQYILESINELIPNGVYLDHLFIDSNYYEMRDVSCLNFIWRGKVYKDMKIKVDIVPAFKIEEFMPAFTYAHNATYYTFCKEQSSMHHDERWLCPVAFSDIELRLIQNLPESAKNGFTMAKGLRVASLFPQNIIAQFQEVYCLQDTLKTYILKTSLIYCYFTLFRERNVLSKEDWAYLIIRHLELRLLTNGFLPTLFDIGQERRLD